MIAEGLALIDKAMRHRRSGPVPDPGGDRGVACRALQSRRTPTGRKIDLLYGALEAVQPSPVVTLNRAVAVSKVRGAAGGA